MRTSSVKLVVTELFKQPPDKFVDEQRIREYFMASAHCPLENATIPSEDLSSVANELLTEFSVCRDFGIGLGSWEAAGVPLLGHFLARIARLCSLALAQHFRYMMEFQVVRRQTAGKDPSTDGAIVAVTYVAHAEDTPVIIYEYKPEVSRPLPGLRDMLELLIQVFYCFQQYKLRTCVICLTDLKTWYYFKATKATRIELTWVKVVGDGSPTPNLSEIQEHLSFVAAAVADVV